MTEEVSGSSTYPRVCPNGHVVSSAAAYCGSCGVALAGEDPHPAVTSTDADSQSGQHSTASVQDVASGRSSAKQRMAPLLVGVAAVLMALVVVGVWVFVAHSEGGSPLALPAADVAQVKTAMHAVDSDLDCVIDTNPALTHVQHMWCITLDRRNDPSLTEQNQADNTGIGPTGCSPGLEVGVYDTEVRTNPAITENLPTALSYLLNRTCAGGGRPRIRAFANSNVLIESTDPALDATATALLGRSAVEILPVTTKTSSPSPSPSVSPSVSGTEATPTMMATPTLSPGPGSTPDLSTATTFATTFLAAINRTQRTSALGRMRAIADSAAAYETLRADVASSGDLSVDLVRCHADVCLVNTKSAQQHDAEPEIAIQFAGGGYTVIGVEAAGSGGFPDYTAPGSHWACTTKIIKDSQGTWVALPRGALVRVGVDGPDAGNSTTEYVLWKTLVSQSAPTSDLLAAPKSVTTESAASAWCAAHS